MNEFYNLLKVSDLKKMLPIQQNLEERILGITAQRVYDMEIAPIFKDDFTPIFRISGYFSIGFSKAFKKSSSIEVCDGAEKIVELLKPILINGVAVQLFLDTSYKVGNAGYKVADNKGTKEPTLEDKQIVSEHYRRILNFYKSRLVRYLKENQTNVVNPNYATLENVCSLNI